MPDERLDRMNSAEMILASNGMCPDCEFPQALTPGPRGGMSQNWACERCGAEFNITQHMDQYVWGQRLTPIGEPNIERLRSVYGIRL